jgi:small subunit ribosomal protein S24e
VSCVVCVLLQIIDVLHPGRANVPKAELKQQICTMFKHADVNCVFVFGFKTDFGGSKSTGFALVYDNFEQAKKFEPKYRLIRVRPSRAMGFGCGIYVVAFAFIEHVCLVCQGV